MKTIRKVVVAISGLAFAGGAALGGAPAASAANWVDCGGRVDFYKLTTDGGRQACFSNYGDAPTSLYGVMHLATGNNSGWVTYMQVSRGTWYDSPYRGHWYYGSFNAAVITGSVHLR